MGCIWSMPCQVWVEVIIGTITSGGWWQHPKAAVWDMVRIMNASRILMVNPFADVHIYLTFA